MSDERRVVPVPASPEQLSASAAEGKGAVSAKPERASVPPTGETVAARRRSRMALRIPDDEVARPQSEGREAPRATPSEPPGAASVGPDGTLRPMRIITINPPVQDAAASAAPAAAPVAPAPGPALVPAVTPLAPAVAATLPSATPVAQAAPAAIQVAAVPGAAAAPSRAPVRVDEDADEELPVPLIPSTRRTSSVPAQRVSAPAPRPSAPAAPKHPSPPPPAPVSGAPPTTTTSAPPVPSLVPPTAASPSAAASSPPAAPSIIPPRQPAASSPMLPAAPAVLSVPAIPPAPALPQAAPPPPAPVAAAPAPAVALAPTAPAPAPTAPPAAVVAAQSAAPAALEEAPSRASPPPPAPNRPSPPPAAPSTAPAARPPKPSPRPARPTSPPAAPVIPPMDVTPHEIHPDDLVALDATPLPPKVEALPPPGRPMASHPPPISRKVAGPPPPAQPQPQQPPPSVAAPPAALPRRPSKPPLVIVPPHMGNVAPQQPEGPTARRKGRLWWEELFNDDYVRACERITHEQLEQEVNFIEESLGVERGGALLDLACGTGRHAVELSRRGYQVVGFDLSLAMLALASDEAQERQAKLNFVQGDMREMAFSEQFDGVYCWNTSFGYFEEEKNALIVDRIHNALKGGGLLLLDVVNRDFLIRQSPSLAWFEGDGCVCMDEMTVDFITSRMRVKRTMMLDDGRTREMEYAMRVYSLHELGKMLHEHGFKVCEVSGRIATPGVFFGHESPRTIILAEKR